MSPIRIGLIMLSKTIEQLEKSKDARVEQIVNNLKHEEEQLDILIMNIEDKNE